jgi:hypothetical protein
MFAPGMAEKFSPEMTTKVPGDPEDGTTAEIEGVAAD